MPVMLHMRCGQVRMLLYLGSLCSGILEALADVERAVVSALACQTPRCTPYKNHNIVPSVSLPGLP
jgi:hypothetical protein